MTAAIHTHQLSRRFRSGHGVHALDLTVPEASLFAFLGPNGAGKTTTIRLLLGLLRPEHGRVALFGEALSASQRAALRHVGAMVEGPPLYPHLTGLENLRIGTTLLGLPTARATEVLQRVDLLDAAARPVREYSLGMRQRLAIAQALLGRPRLLILDEPGNGLDPAGTVALRELLRGFVQQDGLTVFLSSHLLGEVQQLASHVALLQDGRLRFQGPLSALQAQATPRVVLTVDNVDRATALLRAHDLHSRFEAPALVVESGDVPSAQLNRWLVEAGIEVTEFRRESLSLEQLFFRLTDQPVATRQEAA